MIKKKKTHSDDDPFLLRECEKSLYICIPAAAAAAAVVLLYQSINDFYKKTFGPIVIVSIRRNIKEHSLFFLRFPINNKCLEKRCYFFTTAHTHSLMYYTAIQPIIIIIITTTEHISCLVRHRCKRCTARV